MAETCTHRGCQKSFGDPLEPCVYHPGAPVFHEGQKGYGCCKPRVLTFEEFLELPGCTTGTHTTEPQVIPTKPKPAADTSDAFLRPAVPRVGVAIASTQAIPTPQAPKPEEVEEVSDVEGVSIPVGARCKRKGCNVEWKGGDDSKRDEEECSYHNGHAIFHEGSKGWSCCKRRVLEFDEFLKIEGCQQKSRHIFVGKVLKEGEEEMIGDANIRTDFYQTTTNVTASIYLKSIDKDKSAVNFSSDQTIDIDLRTKDKKRFKSQFNLFGKIIPEKSSFKIFGARLELNLVKIDGSGWPVLRSTDPHTGQIIQSGRAGSLQK